MIAKWLVMPQLGTSSTEKTFESRTVAGLFLEEYELEFLIIKW